MYQNVDFGNCTVEMIQIADAFQQKTNLLLRTEYFCIKKSDRCELHLLFFTL